MSRPVEYDSSQGYVSSTPSSKPTGIIGIIENPITKQLKVTRTVELEVKDKAVAIMLIIEMLHIMITESL